MKLTRGTMRAGPLILAIAGANAIYSTHATTPASPKVLFLRAPNNGIQPQSVIDSEGVLHVIYFLGDVSAGDIEYVKREPSGNLSKPIRVNSNPRSAVAIGTVRGPQMSVGRNGRVYVVWFGSQKEAGDPNTTMPVFFTRLDDSRRSFEPQRNLMQYTQGADGGLSIAADLQGHIYAVWHATGAEPGEDRRRVYLAYSSDDGKTFGRELPVSPAELGACGCCGMRALADSHGRLYILYRAAAQRIHRDMTLLVSSDQARTFRITSLSPWELNACPMSTAYLSAGKMRMLASWEKANRVYFDCVDAESLTPSFAVQAPDDGADQKHPAVAVNAKNQILLAWTEGTGWSKGGSLAWQLFDSAGKPLGPTGHVPGVPAWDLPSIFADRDGNFTIAY
jgi:hypothetical protein